MANEPHTYRIPARHLFFLPASKRRSESLIKSLHACPEVAEFLQKHGFGAGSLWRETKLTRLQFQKPTVYYKFSCPLGSDAFTGFHHPDRANEIRLGEVPLSPPDVDQGGSHPKGHLSLSVYQILPEDPRDPSDQMLCEVTPLGETNSWLWSILTGVPDESVNPAKGQKSATVEGKKFENSDFTVRIGSVSSKGMPSGDIIDVEYRGNCSFHIRPALSEWIERLKGAIPQDYKGETFKALTTGSLKTDQECFGPELAKATWYTAQHLAREYIKIFETHVFRKTQ